MMSFLFIWFRAPLVISPIILAELVRKLHELLSIWQIHGVCGRVFFVLGQINSDFRQIIVENDIINYLGPSDNKPFFMFLIQILNKNEV